MSTVSNLAKNISYISIGYALVRSEGDRICCDFNNLPGWVKKLGAFRPRKCLWGEGVLRSSRNLQAPNASLSWEAHSVQVLLQGSELSSDEIQILTKAFDQALRLLSVVDRNDPLTELLARKIIEIGARTIRDPAEIAKAAIQKIGIA